MDLPHVPLFEGEENLKLLSLENNLVAKIDHLVSLNNLLYLNLYNNRITEIENLGTLPRLKAVMLGKNSIEKIKNLHMLTELEVLDLHSNRIKLIQNMNNLGKLRFLNLANNQIKVFSDLSHNSRLEEVNLRRNMIFEVSPAVSDLKRLKKINLSRNFIAKPDSLENMQNLPDLVEIILDENPFMMSKEAPDYLKKLPVKTKPVSKNSKPAKQPEKKVEELPSLAANEDNREEEEEDKTEATYTETLEHINKEWEEEFAKLKEMGFNGYNSRKLKETQVFSAHAEIENETQLKMYGNAVEVLDNEELYNTVSSVFFRYFSFDLIASKENLKKLSKFNKLSKIQFAHNNLHSFYQIIKFESFPKLVEISVKKNEISQCTLLKYFLLYRFNELERVNGVKHSAAEKKASKNLFKTFDDVISDIEAQAGKKMPEIEVESCLEETKLKKRIFSYAEENLLEILEEVINL